MSCCHLLVDAVVKCSARPTFGREGLYSVDFPQTRYFTVHIICLSTQVCVWESVNQLLLFARTCDQYICKNQPNEISINSVKIPFVNEFSTAVGTYSPYCSPYISYGTSKENLSKYQEILSLVITFFILIT